MLRSAATPAAVFRTKLLRRAASLLTHSDTAVEWLGNLVSNWISTLDL
jgi:hypothetical protein